MTQTPQKRKIRVAIMADEFDRRPERTLYFRRLIEGLCQEPDVELTLVHAKQMPDEPLYKEAREIILPRFSLPVATRFISFVRFCLTTQERFDIVHWLVPRLFPFFWLFPARKTVVMAHGGGEVYVKSIWTLARFIFNYTLIWFSRYVDVFIGVSDYASKEIAFAYHVPPEKVHTIYNAVDPIFLSPPDERKTREVLLQYKLPYNGYFFYTGRFRPHKNVGRIVEAFLQFRTENPNTRTLLVLAGDQKEYEKTFGPLPPSPFSNDVRFIGYVPADALPALYCGALALSFATLHEGFGLPPIEAMACGTPVITSTTTSMPEIAGDAAVIVNPRSVEAIAMAMNMIQSDEKLRTLLSKRGRERANFFTYEKTLAHTLELYRSILDERSVIVKIPH